MLPRLDSFEEMDDDGLIDDVEDLIGKGRDGSEVGENIQSSIENAMKARIRGGEQSNDEGSSFASKTKDADYGGDLAGRGASSKSDGAEAEKKKGKKKKAKKSKKPKNPRRTGLLRQVFHVRRRVQRKGLQTQWQWIQTFCTTNLTRTQIWGRHQMGGIVPLALGSQSRHLAVKAIAMKEARASPGHRLGYQDRLRI